MKNQKSVSVIIPAFNEEASIALVLKAIPEWVDQVIVADNGSQDRTAEIAQSFGARVVSAPERGYGSACLAGISVLEHADVVVFLDADFSDYPREEMHLLVDPVVKGEADLTLGARVSGLRQPRALTLQQRFGNWLACAIIFHLWKVSFKDLGPFRAIGFSALKALNMADRNYGWTVEMQIKAIQNRLRIQEIPVRYRPRIGLSKVSGTIKGIFGAGTKILYTIFKLFLMEKLKNNQLTVSGT